MNKANVNNRTMVMVSSAIFLTSVAVTIIFWMILPKELQDINSYTDYITFYKPVAENILEGKGIRLSNGKVATSWPPGYPVVLAGIFGLSRLLGLPNQVLLSTSILVGMGITAIFVYLLGNLVWCSKWALVSVFGWMIFPLTLWLTKQPNSEIFFMVFFYGALVIFWMILKERWMNPYLFGFVGILLGLSMLIRAIGIGLGVLLSILFWVLIGDVKKTIKCQMVLMLLLGNVFVVVPWEAYVYSNTGNFILLSGGSQERVKAGILLPIVKRGEYGEVFLPSDVREFLMQLEAKSLGMTSLLNTGAILSQEFISQPFVAMKFLAIKLTRGWYGTDSGNFEMAILLIQIPFLSLVLWGTFLAWNQGGWERKFVIFVWALVLYFWCMTTIVISLVRFMVPAMALLFLLLPLVGERLWEVVKGTYKHHFQFRQTQA